MHVFQEQGHSDELMITLSLEKLLKRINEKKFGIAFSFRDLLTFFQISGSTVYNGCLEIKIQPAMNRQALNHFENYNHKSTAIFSTSVTPRATLLLRVCASDMTTNITASI